MQKEFFFQGKSVIRKIKDKAFFDFVIAHQNDKNIKYIPSGIYTAPNGSKSVNIISVKGGSIDMIHELSRGGYISEEDWLMLFRETEATDYDELLRRLNDYNEIVNMAKSELHWSTVAHIENSQAALKNFINQMGKKL